MRHKSPIWDTLSKANDYWAETVAVINGRTYTKITAPKIERLLMSKPLSVGNCMSATLDLSILTEDDIPKSSSVVILSRLTNGKLFSEWLEFGTFFIDKRDTSHDGLITLTCYDTMAKANAPYPLRWNDAWPKPMKEVVESIADRLGVPIDPRTRIRTEPDYVVQKPEGLTLQQVLEYIGGCHGGNWIVTEDNQLRLVPLMMSPGITRYITDIEYNRLKTADGDSLVYEGHTVQHPRTTPFGGSLPESGVQASYRILDASRHPILTQDGSKLVWTAPEDAAATDSIVRVPAVLGNLSMGSALTVTGISMFDADGNEFAAGTTNGSIIVVTDNPYVTQGICEALYSAFSGLVYMPYKVTGGITDASCELGDGVIVGDKIHGVIYGIKLTLDALVSVDITAPGSEDIEAEFPYISMEERRYNSFRVKLNNIFSRIERFESKVNISEQRLDALEKSEETDPTMQPLSSAEISALFD